MKYSVGSRVFIVKATATYSLGHGLHTLTAVPTLTAFYPV